MEIEFSPLVEIKIKKKTCSLTVNMNSRGLFEVESKNF